MHSPFLSFLHRPRMREAIFALVSIAAGCTLVQMTHQAPYLEMVEKAPVVATLWMWCVLEMGLQGSVAMGAAVGGFAWWRGYGFR